MLACSAAILALVVADPAVAQTALAAQADADTAGEIVVTAQRRDQSIQDVPYNISAVSGASLAKSGVVGVNSLTQVVAGLVTIDSGPATRGGTNNYTLRGLRTDSTDGADSTPNTVSSVSTYFGDVPVFFPIVLKDIARVEVLRGPQGTLYGSGAQGGTIRFIPNRPNFSKFSGEINGGGGISEHSGKANGNIDGVLNLPITPRLAIRAVGGVNHLGGFIDAVDLLARDGKGPLAGVVSANPSNPTSAPLLAPVKKDVNSSNEYFGRLAVRWQPIDELDLQLDYVHQQTNVDDLQASNAAYPGGVVDFGADFGYAGSAYTKRPGGRYESTFPEQTPYRNNVDLVSGTATVDFGLATFTSVSSYVDNRTRGVYDFSWFWNDLSDGRGGIISYYGGFPRFVNPTIGENDEKSFTQEVRLVSKWDKPIDYVIGGYFQRQKTNNSSIQYGPGMPAFGATVGFPSASPESGDIIFTSGRKTKFLDRAVFGEVTGHITSKFQVTGGIRFFWQQFTYDKRGTNDYCGAICGDGVSQPASLGLVTAYNTSKVHNNIVKANASYDFSKELKAYATYSEGFRRGGANGLSTAGNYRSLPIYATYEPDIAKTYEVGLKGKSGDGRFTFSSDLYLINFDNFQFTAGTPAFSSGVFNGNQARSKGGELELGMKLTPRLSVAGSYTYTDAKVSKASSLSDYPAFSIQTGAPPFVYLTLAKGQKLPGVPMHTVNGSVDYTLPIADNRLTGHLDASYRSKALGAIAVTDRNFFRIAPIFVMNGRISLESQASWGVDLFVNNITNAIGYTGSVGPQNQVTSFTGRTVMRPRTYGTQLHYRF